MCGNSMQHVTCLNTQQLFLFYIYSSSGAVLYYVNTYFEVMVAIVVVIVVSLVKEVELRRS